jgi:hypothetical protein
VRRGGFRLAPVLQPLTDTRSVREGYLDGGGSASPPDSRILLVPEKAPLRMKSSDAALHTVHMDGAATINLPCPFTNQIVSRTMPTAGLANVRCNGGYARMNADILVDPPGLAHAARSAGPRGSAEMGRGLSRRQLRPGEKGGAAVGKTKRGKGTKWMVLSSKRFRDDFGHTPLSVEEDIPWKFRRLVIGTGAYGKLPVMTEVKREAERRKVELLIVPTAAAIEELRRDMAGTNAILHATC